MGYRRKLAALMMAAAAGKAAGCAATGRQALPTDGEDPVAAVPDAVRP